jgi:hypothetical protein
MLTRELSSTGGTPKIRLIFDPLVEALFVKLVLAVQLRNYCLLAQNLQTEAAVIVFVFVLRLVGHILQKIHFHQFLNLYL